jgi:hypothetical protein
MVWMRRPTYSDGSLVVEGDRLRYHQALGGMMPPGADENGDIWNYGVAVKIPAYASDSDRRERAASHGRDVDELVLRCESGPYKGSHCNLFGHVIERIS